MTSSTCGAFDLRGTLGLGPAVESGWNWGDPAAAPVTAQGGKTAEFLLTSGFSGATRRFPTGDPARFSRGLDEERPHHRASWTRPRAAADDEETNARSGARNRPALSEPTTSVRQQDATSSSPHTLGPDASPRRGDADNARRAGGYCTAPAPPSPPRRRPRPSHSRIERLGAQ